MNTLEYKNYHTSVSRSILAALLASYASFVFPEDFFSVVIADPAAHKVKINQLHQIIINLRYFWDDGFRFSFMFKMWTGFFFNQYK
jgi:hypothetical protein